MAGRKLRRQRDVAVAALTDAEAVALAREALANLNDSQALVMLTEQPVPRSVNPRTMPEVRRALAAQLTQDPARARLVVGLCAYLPSVERALGVIRTPGQQRP